MAIIKRFDKSTDLVLEYRSQAHQSKFEFKVDGNRVEAQCTISPIKKREKGEPDYSDWRNALSPEEKVRIFALILDEYRKHSIGDEYGYRGAVLGVTESGDIFLGSNTATGQIASSYLKKCAEQNMVSTASEHAAYQQVKRHGWDQSNPPKAPVFESLYMMGGVNQTQVPVSCPCGMCTDMLANNMVEGGKVYALPILNKATFDYLNSTTPAAPKATANQGKEKRQRAPSAATLPVHIEIDKSDTLAAVRERVTRPKGDSGDKPLQPYHVWETTINHLNADRTIDLNVGNTDIANMQRRAYAKLALDAHKTSSLQEERLATQHQKSIRELDKQGGLTIKSTRQLFEQFMRAPEKLNRRVRALLGDSNGQPSATAMAAANQFVGRHSIAELDVASANNGPNIAAINEFMLSEIRHALADRALTDTSSHGAGKSWMRRSIPHMRCVVIQLNDGTFHHELDVTGKFDASLPNAEALVVGKALRSLGRCRIRDVWVMEMNGEAARDGIMQTSPKEGAERIIKRGDDNLMFHFIPLNEGGYDSQTIDKFTFHRPAEKVMPALFKGSRPLEAKAITPHRAWTEFLSSQPMNGGQTTGHGH